MTDESNLGEQDTNWFKELQESNLVWEGSQFTVEKWVLLLAGKTIDHAIIRAFLQYIQNHSNQAAEREKIFANVLVHIPDDLSDKDIFFQKIIYMLALPDDAWGRLITAASSFDRDETMIAGIVKKYFPMHDDGEEGGE